MNTVEYSKTFSLKVSSLDQTEYFAKRLALAYLERFFLHKAKKMPPFCLRIYLEGDLGVGKTAWVRAFLRALGVKGHIKSPTYALVEKYPLTLQQFGIEGVCSVMHVDAYRLQGEDDFVLSGLEEVFEADVLLLEWPQKVRGVLQEADWWINVLPADEGWDGRIFKVQLGTEWGALLWQNIHIDEQLKQWMDPT
jgi:tRNA threonylcarbamoyladenosine biosynthesis protein TsaE